MGRMNRDLDRLIGQKFDVLIIGGGIYGVAICREAALRGLKVCLVEQDDFGAATSANSLKIIHGGLRYLQDLNLTLVRQMAAARSNWLRVAPNLIEPATFLLPCEAKLSRLPITMNVGLKLNDLLCRDRNRGLLPERIVPDGAVLGKEDAQRYFGSDAKGAASWTDGQIYSAERLLISLLISAAEGGATVANHVTVSQLIVDNDKVNGVELIDTLTGRQGIAKAGVVVDATNGGGLLADECADPPLQNHHSIAFNLVLKGQIGTHALGFPFQDRRSIIRKSETLFLVPWQTHTLLGTIHKQADSMQNHMQVTEAELSSYLQAANSACTAANFSLDDLLQIYFGHLPTEYDSKGQGTLLREGQVIDHSRSLGLDGSLAVMGVKYTTAMKIASEAVELVARKLGTELKQNASAKIVLRQSAAWNPEKLYADLRGRQNLSLSDLQIRHLIRCYGTDAVAVAEAALESPDGCEPLGEFKQICVAQLHFARTHEMALTGADMVRRLGLDLGGHSTASRNRETNWDAAARRLANQAEAAMRLDADQSATR